MVIPIDQEVGDVRRDDVFVWSESHHHVWHAGRQAPGRGDIAQPALGLICEACFEHRFILGRERGFLSVSPWLGLIVPLLARNARDNDPSPLALQIGVFLQVNGLCSGR